MLGKKFKVNKYITLRLEEGYTNIYVDDMLFDQCKYFMIEFDIRDLEKYDSIGSIDE